jgi:DHA2 family methylenomycin A resistance protein-like MFS transporter
LGALRREEVTLSEGHRSPARDDHAATQERDPRPGPALAVALLGFFIVTLDALVVSVALPAISRELHGGLTGLQWVVDGYTLMFAALLLFAGTLSDRIGARQAYRVGLTLFVGASAACGLAPTLGVLVAARLVQGAGAAVMMPASLALLREAYPDNVKRARAIGLWAIGGAVASAVGPVLGGALTLVTWRLIFVINLPVGVVAVALLTRVRRSSRHATPFDWTGQAAALVGMAALTYGIIEGGAAGFGASRVLTALAVAVAAFAVFLIAQVRGTHPMVPLQMFRSRPVVISLAVGFAFMVGYYGLVFVFSLYYQQQRGLSALGAGVAFLPMTALVAFLPVAAARVGARFGLRVPIAAGQCFMAVGLLTLSVLLGSAPTVLLALVMIPIGAGGAIAMPAATTLLLDSVPAQRAGTASGVLNTSRQLGGALAIAVFGALLAHQHFLDGVRSSLVIAGLLLLATTLASLTLRPKCAPG